MHDRRWALAWPVVEVANDNIASIRLQPVKPPQKSRQLAVGAVENCLDGDVAEGSHRFRMYRDP